MTTHASSTKIYILVLCALAVLTAVTVGVSYLHLARKEAIALALFIAGIKVSLIAAFFMHLKFENKIIRAIFFTSIFCALILLFLVFPDLGIRP